MHTTNRSTEYAYYSSTRTIRARKLSILLWDSVCWDQLNLSNSINKRVDVSYDLSNSNNWQLSVLRKVFNIFHMLIHHTPTPFTKEHPRFIFSDSHAFMPFPPPPFTSCQLSTVSVSSSMTNLGPCNLQDSFNIAARRFMIYIITAMIWSHFVQYTLYI